MNILNNNGKYTFFNTLTIDNELVPKNYIFNFDDFGNCWLEDAEDFRVPDKIYDVNSGMREDVIKSFRANKKNLGVLLTGNKGQGKSLNAKLLCKELCIPTIIVNKSIPKDVNFVRFFNNIKQDYCFFVDEFEKLFADKGRGSENKDYHEQDVFLSFMDGVLTNEHKVLFLLTTNDSVNEYFINRPSRVKFLQEYDELSEELFNMIVSDKLENKDFREDLEDNVSLINLNIDLLISIIEDINLFNKPFSDFKEIYNYKLEQYKYEMCFMNGGKEVFHGFFTSKKKLKSDITYINGYNVNQMIKFTKNEIIFMSHKWEEDDKGEDVQKEIKVKVNLCHNSFSINNAF
jgi:hypothetical protein